MGFTLTVKLTIYQTIFINEKPAKDIWDNCTHTIRYGVGIIVVIPNIDGDRAIFLSLYYHQDTESGSQEMEIGAA